MQISKAGLGFDTPTLVILVLDILMLIQDPSGGMHHITNRLMGQELTGLSH